MPEEPQDTKALVEELQTLWQRDVQALREKADANGESLKELTDKDPVAKSQWDALTERMNEAERKLQRPHTGGGTTDEVKHQDLWAHYFGQSGQPTPRDDITPERVRDAKQAFRDYLRKGDHHLGADELKLLSTQDNTSAGYLIEPDFAMEIIKDLTEISPVRSIARVSQTATGVFKVPRRTGTPTASWVGEGDTDSLTDSTYGLEEIPNGTMRATSKATREMIGDTGFDLEAEIRADFEESFQAAEGAAFVSGDGVGKPEGFMTNSDVVGTDVTGDASDITYAGLVEVSHNLNANYFANGRFVMNLATLGKVRQLEDTNGNLLFNPATAGAPSTILGAPFTILQDMPDVASNAYPVAFGDWRRGFRIIDRVMFDLLRDPFTSSRDGAITFTAFHRVGAQIVLPTAIRKLQVST